MGGVATPENEAGEEMIMGRRTDRVFIKGAYLKTLLYELTEDEFVEAAGGIEVLEQTKGSLFVSVVFDDPENVMVVGHGNGRIISDWMHSRGFRKFQTMERRH